MLRPIDQMHRNLTTLEQDGALTTIAQFRLGVRGHRWFAYYHAIGVAYDLALAVLAVMLWVFAAPTLMFALTVLLVLAIGWDVYEYAYSRARFAAWFNPHLEHITFADLMSWHRGSKEMHIGRIIVIILLIGGLV